MTNEITKFEQFFATVAERIDQAQTTDEVIEIREQAATLAAMARVAKDREYEEKAATVKQQAERRLGQLMAAQRDAGMMKVGRPKNGSAAGPILKDVGIGKRLADAARKAYPEGWPKKTLKQDLARTAVRNLVENNKPISRKGMAQETGFREHTIQLAVEYERGRCDGLNEAKTRIIELEAEVATLKNDLEALQKGQLMQMSRAALIQRKELAAKIKAKREERRAAETIPDEKTKEEFERQIKVLKSQLKTEKSKVLAFAANGATVLDKNARKAILVCLHPDGAANLAEKARRENAFKLFTNAVPEPDF